MDVNTSSGGGDDDNNNNNVSSRFVYYNEHIYNYIL